MIGSLDALTKDWLRVLMAILVTFSLMTPASAETYYPDASLPDQADVQDVGSIAYYVQHSQPGDTIYLVAGSYYLAESIVLRSNVHIMGEGSTSIVRGLSTLNDHLFNNRFVDNAASPGIKNVILENFQMVGQPTARKSCLVIRSSNITPSQDITLRNLTVSQCGRHGIHLKAVMGATLSDLTLYHNGQNVGHDHNLYLIRVRDAEVNTVTTQHAAGTGLSLTQVSDTSITAVTASYNRKRGIKIAGSSQVDFSAITMLYNGRNPNRIGSGLVLTSDDYDHHNTAIMINGCNSGYNDGSGLRVEYTTGLVLADCQVHDNNNHGILVAAGSDIILSDLIIAHNGGYGLVIPVDIAGLVVTTTLFQQNQNGAQELR